jgi:endonuclease/exonuclease/phosphatase family metal-dependent hydrolase
MVVSANRKKTKQGFWRIIMLLITFIMGAALILSYLASYISPDKIWIIAFFGLGYPFLLLTNLLLMLYWLVLRKFVFIFPLLIILAGWTNIRSLIGFHKNHKITDRKNLIKVMSYNVRNFDLYNYKPGWEYNFEKRDKIFDFIKEESADIICFQEFFYDATNNFSTIDTLLKFQKAIYYNTEYTAVTANTNKFGIATFSAFPIINSGKILFGEKTNNVCIYSDIVIGEDTVRVYNVHFESIKLGAEDYALAKDFSHINKPDGSNVEIKKKSVRLMKRMKSAFINRVPQVRMVRNSIENCKYPVILCGDFNDTPTSYVYHLIASHLTDSFVESGSGLGKSYIGLLPTFRIDYIFHSKEYISVDFQTIHIKMSDHYPVVSYLKKKQ